MSNVISRTIDRCRICNAPNIQEILDLGAHPPANSLRRSLEDPLPAVPLILCRCGACGTVQLTETVSPEYLFRDYVWVTGTSQVAREYSAVFCERLEQRCGPRKLSVIEVASNDGTFLARFKERGHDVLGVDPAENLAHVARRLGIPTLPEFFGLSVARQIVATQGCADVVFARNVLPHVADIRDVVAGLTHCLSDQGTGAIEFHHANTILEELHYDSIYHEHLFYHSLHSIEHLFREFGLAVFDVDDSPISGGSLVVYFSKLERPRTPALLDIVERERGLGIDRPEPWLGFADQCRKHRDRLTSMVEAEIDAGRRLIGYGASARSSTLLNFCAIDYRHLAAVADRNPLKHGRFTPGTNIPIMAPEQAFAPSPDTVLLLGWNFRDEILAQMHTEQGWNGRVIQPLPGDPSIVTVQ